MNKRINGIIVAAVLTLAAALADFGCIRNDSQKSGRDEVRVGVTGPETSGDNSALPPNAEENELVLARVVLDKADYPDRTADLTLEFNHPVDPGEAAKKIEVFFNEEKITEFQVERAGEENKLSLSTRLGSTQLNNSYTVRVLEGLRDKDGKTKMERNYVSHVKLGQPPGLNFYSVSVREGAGGFYLFVDCDDYSERYSGHCSIDKETLKKSVGITPDASVTFAPEAYGFKVFGEFKKGEYVMKVKKGMRSEGGGFLLQDFERRFVVPSRNPSASFLAKGRYLPRNGLASVPIRHMNVDKVDVVVRKIPEHNLIFWLSGSREKADNRTSDVIAQKTFAVEKKEDVQLTSWLDFSGLVPADKKGAFELTLAGGQNSDAVRLILTDLTLVSKTGEGEDAELLVWALGSEDLRPAKAAEIKVMSMSGQVLASSVTDADGLARFKASGLQTPGGGGAFAVMAKKGDDLTVMKFEDLETSLSEFEAQGTPYKDDKPYRAALYMDRGVYRPGETAHLAAVVWEDKNAAPDAGLPLMGVLTDPRGKATEKIRAFTNEAGMAEFEFDFADYADTGKYDFTLKIGDWAAGSHSFHVEEFMPERMKATVEAMKDKVDSSEAAAFELSAQYLFGSKAKGERMEAECVLGEGRFKPEEFPGYQFGVFRPDPFRPLPLGRVKGNLNENGTIEFSCPAVSDVAAFFGPGEIKVMASVFESGSGRVTAARDAIAVHPAAYYLGLITKADKAVSGQYVDVEGVVVDWDGNLLPEPGQVEINVVELQSEYVWEYDPNEGRSTWRRFLRESPAVSDVVSVTDGRFKTGFMPTSDYSYGYLVRASAGANVRTDLFVKGDEGYWYGWDGDEGDKTPRPGSPEGLALTMDGEVKVGMPAEVGAMLPYAGKLLFTVETDKVIEQKWIDVKAGEWISSFTLPEFAPNVYVSALLIKDPHYESKELFVPGRSFGVKSVKVNPSRFEANLSVKAPGEVKPNETLTIELETDAGAGPVFATVAAVDEGILQLTDFETPAPLEDLFRKRALGVKTYETVGWTLLLPQATREKTTGGGDSWGEEYQEEASTRVQPVKPAALWSGILEVGPDGKASVDFEVPSYRGKLRVMAVVAGKNAVGSGQAEVLVRDPLVLQPTFPRFLSDGDEFVTPVFLSNLTGETDTIEVTINVNDKVKIEGENTKSIVLKKDQSGVVTFLCKASGVFGAAEFDVTASGAKNASRDSARIPLVPNGPVIQELNSRTIKPGENDLSEYLEGWVPSHEMTTVTATANPYAMEMAHLKYLIRYPYGCIEQTTSTTRPLLYVGNLVSSLDPEVTRDGNIEEKFMFGVRRLFSMQTRDGGFSYWPGQRENTYWGTAYATHVLLEGIEAGYPVDKDRVDEAVAFIERVLTDNPSLIDPKYGYSVAKSEPYMQFVLAKAGKARQGRIKSLIENHGSDWNEMEDENMFLLKAALYLSGDRSYEDDLKTAYSKLGEKRLNDWSFWSALRTRGLMMNVLEDLFPNDPALEPLARSISERLSNESDHYTTQELSWCVSGLGKRAGSGASSWSRPTLALAGKVVKPEPTSLANAAETAWQIRGASGIKDMVLKVDSIEGGDLFALVRVEGIKPGKVFEEKSQGLEVTREYLDADGAPLDLGNLELGQLAFVRLTLTNKSMDRVRNVALVDRFAAGFDVENPRLNREHASRLTDTDSIWKADHMNPRDDRVEIFGGLERNQTVTAMYVLRAVVSGKFATPPLRAEAMYDPSVLAQKPGGKVLIHDPWNVLSD